jgi:hypothetical protein
MEAEDSSKSSARIFKFIPIIIGIITIIVSYGVHFATIDYGKSGSEIIGSQISKTIWPLGIGLSIILLGFVYWIWAGFNSEYRFFGLFILCLLCLLSSNAALYFSLTQVKVTSR